MVEVNKLKVSFFFNSFYFSGVFKFFVSHITKILFFKVANDSAVAEWQLKEAALVQRINSQSGPSLSDTGFSEPLNETIFEMCADTVNNLQTNTFTGMVDSIILPSSNVPSFVQMTKPKQNLVSDYVVSCYTI